MDVLPADFVRLVVHRETLILRRVASALLQARHFGSEQQRHGPAPGIAIKNGCATEIVFIREPASSGAFGDVHYATVRARARENGLPGPVYERLIHVAIEPSVTNAA